MGFDAGSPSPTDFKNANVQTRPRPQASRLFDPKLSPRSTPSSLRSEWSTEATPTNQTQSPARPASRQTRPESKPPHRQPGLIELQKYDPRYPGLLLQPDSRPISQEQLASEVKSIYAGLTMVESKCIHVDRALAVQDKSEPKLASDHWQALIALHRTLLHEHHDFFLASQHPSASPALRRLAAKYSMPARMWKHGIHSFLELLRRRMPDSIDHMLAFIYLAYQTMALLYETVPAFGDTWIECLGDVGRYRMAIEDEVNGTGDRKSWGAIARSWYTKAADKYSSTGRLYHHLEILARPNALSQLYYFSRSLTCINPFPSAREYIFTLMDAVDGFPGWQRLTKYMYTENWWKLLPVVPSVGTIECKELPEDYLIRGTLWPNNHEHRSWYLDANEGKRHQLETDSKNTRETEYSIPGILGSKHIVNALGDYGAKYNFVNENYAIRHRFDIDRKQTTYVTVGSCRKVRTAGVAEVPFCFQDEETPYLLRFHVLPGCVRNVILGKRFLKATKTFSSAVHFAKRVVSRIARSLSKHQILYLGESAPRFTGLINGQQKEALADSGAKVLIMDEDYARTAGLPIVITAENSIKLRFADGSTTYTSGKTYGVSWTFGPGRDGKSYPLDFYILKNAPADVILSEDFLLRETQAFIEYDCYLLDDDEEDEDEEGAYIFAIDRAKDYRPQTQLQGAEEHFEDDRETTRREQEDAYIATLVGADQDDEIARVKDRRAQWAAAQAALQNGQAAPNNPPNAGPAGANAQPNNGAGPPPASRINRLRFKLKRKLGNGNPGGNP